jgi:UDP-N-acetylmuramate--alanine ligase
LPIEGVTSSWLLDKITVDKKQISSKEDLVKNVLNLDSQVIVMIGAGDIGELVAIIKNALSHEN